jgi:hypothetical protein
MESRDPATCNNSTTPSHPFTRNGRDGADPSFVHMNQKDHMDSIAWELRSHLIHNDDHKSGLLYIFHYESSPGHVTIGQTSGPVRRGLKRWKKGCSRTRAFVLCGWRPIRESSRDFDAPRANYGTARRRARAMSDLRLVENGPNSCYAIKRTFYDLSYAIWTAC